MKSIIANIMTITLIMCGITVLCSCGQDKQIQELQSTTEKLEDKIEELENEPEPECSILEYSGDWTEEEYGGYMGFNINARVVNIGGDGSFNVHANVTPNDDGGVLGECWQTKSIYLTKGQETILNFFYWIDGELSYRVFCEYIQAPVQ